MYILSKLLEQNETVELHELGSAMSTSAKVAEYLVRNEKASYLKVQTDTVSIEGNRKGVAKLFITLKRSPNFFQVMEKVKLIKAEEEAHQEEVEEVEAVEFKECIVEEEIKEDESKIP